MTARAAEVRAGRGKWYAACDQCRWLHWAGSRAGAQHLAELHNGHHHKAVSE